MFLLDIKSKSCVCISDVHLTDTVSGVDVTCWSSVDLVGKFC